MLFAKDRVHSYQKSDLSDADDPGEGCSTGSIESPATASTGTLGDSDSIDAPVLSKQQTLELLDKKPPDKADSTKMDTKTQQPEKSSGSKTSSYVDILQENLKNEQLAEERTAKDKVTAVKQIEVKECKA